MFALRPLLLLAAAASVFGTLVPRQATNTNAAISNAINELDRQMNVISPTILTLQANHTASDATIKTQVNALSSAFSTATTSLKAIAVSSGSTTVSPTNTDISVIFGDVMQTLASTFSGLIGDPTVVPSLPSLLSGLDPIVAATTTQLNTTLPDDLEFVHILMLDAQQFLVKQAVWPQTLAALGF